MNRLISISVLAIFCWVFYITALSAEPFLEMRATCQGRQSDTTNRFKIIGWNGQSKREFSQTVYDFRIDCGGTTRHIIDVYLAGTDDQRYEKRGATLYKHTKDQSKLMPIPESERDCRMDEETDWVSRTPDELFKICRGNGNCEIEHSAYKVTKMVKSCRRPRTEYRNVPLWEPFPTGYGPLPPGANIIDVAQIQPSIVSDPVPQSSARNTTSAQRLVKKKSPETNSPPTKPYDDGPGIGSFVLFLLAAGIGFAIYRNQKNAPLRSRIDEVRRNINREYQGFGIDIQAERFGEHSSGFDKHDPETELSGLNMDLSSLKNCRGQYQKTMRLVDELENLCRASKYHDLDEDIVKTKSLLGSEDLLSHLIRKDWQTFQGFVSDIADHIKGYIERVQNTQTNRSQARTAGGNSFHPDSSEIPTSREDAFAILNISEDTPLKVVKRKYRAMAQVWQVERADSEEDRKYREEMLTQLNVAYEFVTGKRK